MSLFNALQPPAVHYSSNSTKFHKPEFQPLVTRSGSAGQSSQTSSATRQGSLSRCQRQLGLDWDHPWLIRPVVVRVALSGITRQLENYTITDLFTSARSL
jgi:hypothetical protein